MKVLELIKRYWKALLSGLGVILGYIFLRQYFQKDLLAKLMNQATQAKDDVLNERKSNVQSDLKDESKNQEALRDQLDNKAPKASPDEVEDFYKNRK